MITRAPLSIAVVAINLAIVGALLWVAHSAGDSLATKAEQCRKKRGDLVVVISDQSFTKCVRWVEYKEVE